MKKNILYNKKATYNFTIKKKITAGIVLNGWETKCIRKKNINLDNSYVTINNKNIPLIKNIHIKQNIYNPENNNNTKTLKILLKKKEIKYLKDKIKQKGYTIIVVAIIIQNPWFKAKIALAKGKKIYNKKKKITKKQWNKDKKKLIFL